MNFEEWKKWKESQPKPTCDYFYCQNTHPVWRLPGNKTYFCAQHGATLGGISGMRKMYGEDPEYIG